MLKEAMQYFMETCNASILANDEGREYSDKKLFPVLKPEPDTLHIATLTGVLDYLEADVDTLERSSLLLQVSSPTTVKLLSRLIEPWDQRKTYVKASHDQPQFPFGRYLDVEVFVVELQAKFVPDEMTARLLQVIGNITDGVVNTFADDGVTQQVTTKSGVGRVESAPIPNPITLHPYRTFSEIDQPPAKFILRLQSGQGQERPKVALFEADGGAWQLEAIKRVQKWLRDNVPTEVAVIA
jgi:hypothetical protein